MVNYTFSLSSSFATEVWWDCAKKTKKMLTVYLFVAHWYKLTHEFKTTTKNKGTKGNWNKSNYNFACLNYSDSTLRHLQTQSFEKVKKF